MNPSLTVSLAKYIMAEMERQNGQIKQMGVKLAQNADTFEVMEGGAGFRETSGEFTRSLKGFYKQRLRIYSHDEASKTEQKKCK